MELKHPLIKGVLFYFNKATRNFYLSKTVVPCAL
jgi:hypothetical protein